MKEKVGFIGLGSMGRRMAANVCGGFPTSVFDLREDAVAELAARGAEAADNVTDIAGTCNRILLSLPDADAVGEVVFGEGGLFASLEEGDIVVDCGTTHPEYTRAAARGFAGRGAFFLDAPVTGMETRAEAGTLTVMVGGDEGAFAAVLPVLERIGSLVLHMGESGNGQLAKMTNNVLYNISCAAMAEMLPFAVRLGLDPEKMRRVVGTGSGQSFGFDYFSERALRGVFDEGYPMGAAFKDMKTVMENADALQVPLPVASAAMQTYKTALARGFGEESKGAMIKVWEQVMGVEVRSPEEEKG